MRIRVVGSVLLILVALPSLASARTRPWIGVHGGLSTYSMGDVNKDIRNLNALIAPLAMDEINDGSTVGAMLGLELASGLSIAVGYNRLNASSDVGDPTGSIEYDFPADVFHVLGQYSIKGAGVSGVHVGGSLGIVSSAGSVTVTETGTGSASADTKGSGPFVEGYLGGDWWGSPQFAITVSAGYRYAKIGGITINGTPVYSGPGDEYGIDYSGVFIRAGLKLALTK